LQFSLQAVSPETYGYKLVHFGDTSIDGKITLKYILKERSCEDVEWIHLARI
jgi:hypothetical protein